MKKVLILAYDFPPYISVGALRPYSWYRYLKEYDVYPIIVTRQWDNRFGNHLDYVAPGHSKETLNEESEYGTLIKTPYYPNLSNRLLLKYGDKRFIFLRKIITGFFEYFQFLFFIGPKAKLYFAAKQYLKTNQVEAIIATGDPFILFKYASILSKKNRIPWFADYRDPWIQNKKSKGLNFFLYWQSFFEKRFLRNVQSIITVSSFVKSQIELNISGKNFEIVTNGFDIQPIDDLKNSIQNPNCLSIAFMGTIYKWHPIKSFLEVCKDFLKTESNINFKINYYGLSNEWELRELIKSDFTDLMGKWQIFPKLPNELLLKELSKNNLFLLFNDYSILGTKIYDYLVIQRKILLCFKDDEGSLLLKNNYFHIKEFNTESNHLQEDLIKATNSGIIVKDKGHLKTVLLDLYSEFNQNGFIACNSINTEQFSRKIQAQKLAEIIKKTLDT